MVFIWLPRCNSIRRKPGVAEPEVYFRIIHVTLDDVNGFPAYREQTVEIALGPKGAFKNGKIGRLTRRVPASQVVTAVPERNRRAKRKRPPKKPKTPPVVETLRKALEWRRQLDAGEVASQADIARREGVSRARVTQILMLLRLAPEIQERILSMPKSANPPRISERVLRPIAQKHSGQAQIEIFNRIIGSYTD